MRTRFAPSPTGFLHLGHVVNAIYVWGHARRAGGEVLLRIEDHDRQRSRPEYEAALLDDLDWLGFVPDIYPTAAFRRGRCDGRQSDRETVYRDAFQPLVTGGVAFGCDCTRKQTQGGRCAAGCRDRGLPLAPELGWRVQLAEAEGGDVLVRDRLGNWSYQWCVSVDDLAQQITHVIRGEDLRDSTPRQIALARMLGRELPPAFVHHPLVMKAARQKLSKSDGDSGIRELRGAGFSASAVIGKAAHAVGLLREPIAVEATEVVSLLPVVS